LDPRRLFVTYFGGCPAAGLAPDLEEGFRILNWFFRRIVNFSRRIMSISLEFKN
jgi:hypothetical protein